MARVNIDILGISELKWMRMGEFNSNDHYSYYCGQESLRRNGVALIVNKSLKCSTWVQSQKWQNDSVPFQGKPFNISAIQVYAPAQWQRSWNWTVLWGPKRHSRTPKRKKKKDILFIIEDQNAKVGNQEIPEIAGKFGLRKNEARQRLTEFCQETLFFSRTEMRRGEKIK